MGIIFDLQRCCYHDGPGIRTTVFLKGCQLRCAWCHNPESLSPKIQLQYLAHLCSGCRHCAEVCPNGVHTFAEDGLHTVDFSKCTACGQCTEQCPSDALHLFGREMSAAEVISIVLQDRSYYEHSGGGVTFSGGEPTCQPQFLLELLTLAKEASLHTCLETNGYIPGELLKQITPLVDLFYLDYKITDPEALQHFTGAHSPLWENTLRYLNNCEKKICFRMPVIPGINDTPEHFAHARELQAAYPSVYAIELLPYHSIGAAKWEQIGLTYSLKDTPVPGKEQVRTWNSFL